MEITRIGVVDGANAAMLNAFVACLLAVAADVGFSTRPSSPDAPQDGMMSAAEPAVALEAASHWPGWNYSSPTRRSVSLERATPAGRRREARASTVPFSRHRRLGPGDVIRMYLTKSGDNSDPNHVALSGWCSPGLCLNFEQWGTNIDGGAKGTDCDGHVVYLQSGCEMSSTGTFRARYKDCRLGTSYGPWVSSGESKAEDEHSWQACTVGAIEREPECYTCPSNQYLYT